MSWRDDWPKDKPFPPPAVAAAKDAAERLIASCARAMPVLEREIAKARAPWWRRWFMKDDDR